MSQRQEQRDYKLPLPGFRLSRGLIPLFNDNHVDNYLKEILAFVYYASIVNKLPKEAIFIKTVSIIKDLIKPFNVVEISQKSDER